MNPEQRALARAKKLYPNSTRFQNTYMKGYRAALAGRPRESCPYKPDPLKTWGGVWRRAWLQGYQSVVR